jgi:phosphohistidine swiveling domain-containing protein
MVTATAGLPRFRLLSSHDAARLDARVIGGKAAGLARLAALDVRVPAWVVLPATTLRAELVAARLDDEVDRLLTDLGSLDRPHAAHVASASAALRGIVAALTLDDAREALADVRAALCDGDFAVRSSAVGEDGHAHSFAGQFDTVLNVRDEQALVHAVRTCWSSAFSERALDYRLRSGSLDQTLELAVVVQRMIAGDASGVLFTTDPLTGDERRVRISACRGTGERLVAGAVDADEIVADRAGVILESRYASIAPAIDAATVQSLVRAAVKIAEAERQPRDIEWTVAAGEVWFLQSRPVVERAPIRPSSGIVWDNSNIQESYCGVTTPLTFSFARAAYAAVYTQTMRAVGIRESTIAEHRELLNGLLGLIHGRVYYNLNNWYRGLLLLPAFRRNKADMERMMGVDEPVDFVEDETPSRRERLRRVPRIVVTALGLGRRFLTIERDARAFLARFDALVTSIDRATIRDRSLADLRDLLGVLRRDGIDRWTTPIVNDFRVMMSTGRLRRIVERAVGGETDHALQTLLGGADVAVSSAPAMLMLRMADVVKRSPIALAALTDGHPHALSRAGEASVEFAALLRELLDQYGDRCMGELKLESRSLREDHSFVATMIANYLRADAQDADTTARSARERRATMEADVERRMTPLVRVRLRRALRSARASIRAREAMRLARSRLFGIHRQVYQAIGVRFVEQKRLAHPVDIFYLTVEEIDGALAGDSRVDLSAVAQTRRASFAGFTDLPTPNRIVTTTVPDPFATAPHVATMHAADIADSRILRGLGCSPGVAEGPVRIISGPDDDLAIDGHVLVATRTDPGWSPLFHTAAAVVVERGSVLSHSAVLARELGLPAVVGIPGLVSALRDGERVRVDGGAGTLERLDSR